MEGMFLNDIVVLENILDGISQPTQLSLPFIRYLTGDFSEKQVVLKDGFGVFYKGEFKNRNIYVKKLIWSKNSSTVFHVEIGRMMSVNHKNIVRFLGYCDNAEGTYLNVAKPGEPESLSFAYKEERILCFEYTSNGILTGHIHDELRGLQWHTRYKIIKEICQGLLYLHNEKRIIHRDLKPGNILLDNLMVPKIMGLRISALLEDGVSKVLCDTAFGSWTYAAPESEDGICSFKYDIYSLGVIIIELVTGARKDPDVKNILTRWRHRWNKSNDTLRYRQVAKCIEIGLSCQHSKPKNRPSISKIIKDLEDMDGGNDVEDVDGGNGAVGQVIPCWNEMLWVEPPELFFPFEINKRISCSLELYNEADTYMAFFIKTGIYEQYDVDPEIGVVHPCSYYTVNITLLAQVEPPEEMRRTNEFTVKSIRVNEGLTADDITRDIFSKKSGNIVDKMSLGIVFDAQLRAPCMVEEEPEEHLSVEALEISCSQEIVEQLAGIYRPTGMEEKFRDDIVLLENILDGNSEPTELPLSFIKYMTDDFSEKRVIESGGFGVVNKGELKNRNIAVKKLKLSNKAEEDFNREIDSLMRVNHRNVVQFLGYCNETKSTLGNAVKPGELRSFLYTEERVICFEYVSNGSLTGHLHDELRGHEWHTRYKILKENFQGLQYLHNQRMIHRDLKPDNILLDNLMVPKIADLGICKLLEDGRTHVMTSNASATRRYAAPEFDDGHVSLEYDIYSLGIIIIELVTGFTKDPDVKNVLARWRYRWNKSNETLKYQQVAKCIEIGLSCKNKKYKRRPSISKIIKDLDDVDGGKVAVGQEILCWNDMLWVEPPELFFPFQINKQIACSLELYNKADAHMAFFVKTDSQFKYDVDPKKGVVHPCSHITVKIKLLAQEEPPEKKRNAGEFIVKSTRVNKGLTAEDVTKDIFSKNSDNIVDKMRIGVVFDAQERAPCFFR